MAITSTGHHRQTYLLLLKERIVYSLVPAVTELIIAELLYLQYEDPDKPIKFTSTLPALLVTTANRLF